MVHIDNKPWAAGVEPYRLQGWARALFANYPATPEYKALYYASLLVCESDKIDYVVTGLPVAQAKDPERVAELRKMMVGKHEITPKRTVEVAEVYVLPQPVGAWLDYLGQNNANAATLEHARVLILDPGFFSFDWVVIEEGELRNTQTGTSTAAMSALIEAVDSEIKLEFGGAPGRDKIERAMRDGRMSVTVHGKEVDLEPYVIAAADVTAPQALAAMQQNLRTDARPFDAVLLTGGGANIYAPSVQKLFPKAQLLKSKETVHANARGFWSFAQ